MRPDFLHEVSNFLASSTLAWTITFEPFPAPSATIEFIQDRSLGQAGMSGSAILRSLGDSHAFVHRDDEKRAEPLTKKM